MPATPARPTTEAEAETWLVTLNGGSSSLKMALFALADPPSRRAHGMVERIGLPGARLSFTTDPTDVTEGGTTESAVVEAPDHARALDRLLDRLEPFGGLGRVAAVGHRIVHGGPHLDRPALVTDALLAELRSLSPLDPDHMPAELAVLEAVRRRAPALPQVACFDTAFHRTMPRAARMVALPRAYESRGVQRDGFHGLSYTFLVEQLARVAGPEAARGRLVLAHLGAGASLAAVRDGRSVDTTMGFTPTSGVMMGTRSGDLDPGVLLYLLRSEGVTVDELDDLVNRRSGLLGVSGTSSDMRDLLARERDDERAAEAIALFCHHVTKAIGALAATLGGVDTLVFAGGIGEHAAPVRARVGASLSHLGIELDGEANARGAAVISATRSACTVRVMHTDEESILARETMRAHGVGNAPPRQDDTTKTTPSRGEPS